MDTQKIKSKKTRNLTSMRPCNYTFGAQRSQE